MAKEAKSIKAASTQVQAKTYNPVLQRSAIRESDIKEVPPIVHDVLRSPGTPLDQETRGFMESRFGEDFSPVRVHTDGTAAASARAVNAFAYTVGRDVVFNTGQYAPQSDEGRKLLAHELTHVVQQVHNGTGSSNLAVQSDSANEEEARRNAASLSTMSRFVHGSANNGQMQRSTWDNAQLIHDLLSGDLDSNADRIVARYGTEYPVLQQLNTVRIQLRQLDRQIIEISAESMNELQQIHDRLHTLAPGIVPVPRIQLRPLPLQRAAPLVIVAGVALTLTQLILIYAIFILLIILIILMTNPQARREAQELVQRGVEVIDRFLKGPLPIPTLQPPSAPPQAPESEPESQPTPAPPTPAPPTTAPPTPAPPTTAPPTTAPPTPAPRPTVQRPVPTPRTGPTPRTAARPRPTEDPHPIPPEPDERERRRAYPIFWPVILRFPLKGTFRRVKGAPRDTARAQQRRLEMRARQEIDPDFDASLYHAHHVTPLFLDGLDNLYTNGTLIDRINHLRGHRRLAKQPQMQTPPPGLPPISTNLYDHPDGTNYYLAGFKETAEEVPAEADEDHE